MPRPPAGKPGTVGPDEEASALGQAAAELGLTLGSMQFAQLLDYCALLRKWNAVYNLTAVRDPAAMLVQHLFDCLAIIPQLCQPPVLTWPKVPLGWLPERHRCRWWRPLHRS